MISYACIYPSNYSTQYNNFEKAIFGTGVISKFFRVSWLVYSTFSTNTNCVCVWEGVIILPFVIGICQNLVDVEPTICLPYRCFPKCWHPTTMGFPTKNDHFGVFGEYHYLRKQPYNMEVSLSWCTVTQMTKKPLCCSSGLPNPVVCLRVIRHLLFLRSKCSSMCDSNWWCVLRLPHSLSW